MNITLWLTNNLGTIEDAIYGESISRQVFTAQIYNLNLLVYYIGLANNLSTVLHNEDNLGSTVYIMGMHLTWTKSKVTNLNNELALILWQWLFTGTKIVDF